MVQLSPLNHLTHLQLQKCLSTSTVVLVTRIGIGIAAENFPYYCSTSWTQLFATLFTKMFLPSSDAVPRMSLKELIECKHPTAWMEFERGLINEMELAKKFFKDGRPFDLEGLKSCMRNGYYYIEGIEGLLNALKQKNYEMHAFTNYPIWYEIIEDKLKLSTYLSWSFCSCFTGKRKPEPDFYLEVLRHLDIEPANCVFIDDRVRNVEAAKDVGIIGLHFKDANLLLQDLTQQGIDISVIQT